MPSWIRALIFAFAALAAATAQPQPAQVLRGTFTTADLHTYRLQPFTVPAGTRRITIAFTHDSAAQRTVIDFGVFDPQRFRGWSGSDKTVFTISEIDATPSYLPGALPAGTWQLLLGVPNIREGVTTHYTARIYFSSSVEPANVPEAPPHPVRAGAAWYQGDLHDHTGHSDGTCLSMQGQKVPCPQFRLLERTAELKLDFVAMTDHNTVSHHNALEHWQPYFDNLLLIRGRELTTFFGHANLYGTSEWVDFRVRPGYTANNMAAAAHQLGALISINHPARPSGESCMGCGWTAAGTDFANFDSVEAVNGNDADSILSGIPFWEARLNAGLRMTAIGGSDDHRLTTSGPDTQLGTPTTVVYAPELSERGILDAIKAGHVFLKLVGTSGPSVYLTATAAGQKAIVGDNVHAAAGGQMQFSVQVVGAPGARVEVIRDGKIVPLLTDAEVGTADETLQFTAECDGARHWTRVNVRSAAGKLLALTNPIYENFAK